MLFTISINIEPGCYESGRHFVAMEKSPLEEAESLEQLRALENGHRIKVLVTD